MRKILFVCHGNICRSPMAEFYLRHRVNSMGLADKFEISSAATSSEEEGNPVYPLAKRMLASRGIGCKEKTARCMVSKDYKYYDYIIAMDHNKLKEIKTIIGEDTENKVSLLLDHTMPSDIDHHNRDVKDPWYTRHFDVAFDDITIGCDALLSKWYPTQNI